MIQTTPEVVGQTFEEPLGLHLPSPDDPIFRQWLDVRRAYVEMQGWHFGEDWDDYDANSETHHILMSKQGSILTGMRLTPASAPDETLSWSMLSAAMQEDAVARLPEATGETIWDLTRLIGKTSDAREATDAFVQMFAVGLKLTQKTVAEPRWFFTTTRPLYTFFKRKGIEFTPVVRGKINPEDDHESLFCYIDPAACLETIKARPTVHRYVFQAAMKGAELIENNEAYQ